MTPPGVDVRLERAEFDGVIIAILAYGALLMLYIQLLRVLLTRPKRGKVFWLITVYSALLFTLGTIAAGGKIRVAEWVYVSSRFADNLNFDTWVPSRVYQQSLGSSMNMMSRVCTTLTPWIGDAFMIYRLMVIWNYKWWMLLVPVPLYLSHVGMSLPLLIAETRPNDARWEAKSHLYGVVFHSICVSLNIVIAFFIAVRLLTMRKSLEATLGRLNAAYYTSVFTVVVESGAFAALWGTIYLATLAQNHWSQDAFLQPYYYIIALTRMIIVLRMAQNQAWCRETVSAASADVMDWEVSSAHTMQFEIPPSDIPKEGMKPLKSPVSSSTSMHTLGP